jgi:hypothetical protein
MLHIKPITKISIYEGNGYDKFRHKCKFIKNHKQITSSYAEQN